MYEIFLYVICEREMWWFMTKPAGWSLRDFQFQLRHVYQPPDFLINTGPTLFVYVTEYIFTEGRVMFINN